MKPDVLQLSNTQTHTHMHAHIRAEGCSRCHGNRLMNNWELRATPRRTESACERWKRSSHARSWRASRSAAGISKQLNQSVCTCVWRGEGDRMQRQLHNQQWNPGFGTKFPTNQNWDLVQRRWVKQYGRRSGVRLCRFTWKLQGQEVRGQVPPMEQEWSVFSCSVTWLVQLFRVWVLCFLVKSQQTHPTAQQAGLNRPACTAACSKQSVLKLTSTANDGASLTCWKHLSTCSTRARRSVTSEPSLKPCWVQTNFKNQSKDGANAVFLFTVYSLAVYVHTSRCSASSFIF